MKELFFFTEVNLGRDPWPPVGWPENFLHHRPLGCGADNRRRPVGVYIICLPIQAPND